MNTNDKPEVDGFVCNLDPLETSDPPEDLKSRALYMQQRCRRLLDELQQFQAHLKLQKKENHVELRTFKSSLQSEMKILNRLVVADPSDPKIRHALNSSNFPPYAVIWDIAKTCNSITAFGKRFYWVPGQSVSNINGSISNGTAHKKHSAVVTIISQDGAEWVKISTITEKRIIWDLAKAGWVADSDSEDGELPLEDDDNEPRGLLKQAEALVKAANATRVRYRHPTLRLILPKIKAVPDSKEVGLVLRRIRELGITVESLEDMPETLSIEKAVTSMAADRYSTFSETLNIDCTILLAFASDLSHGRVEPEDWHNKAISRQLEMESEDQLLPNSLWPACGNKQLVCTKEAAVRMGAIVAIIGTEDERKRATLLLDQEDGLTRDEIIHEFQLLSGYEIPKDWQLPIQVVDPDLAALKATLPPIARQVSDSLSDINQSVFLYGWATNQTTISSNRAVSKEIEVMIEENRVDEETVGPHVWLCSTSRSLVGKEKQKRGFQDTD